MFKKQKKFRAAFTLVEAVVTSAVLCIIAIGSLNFQYFAARDSKLSHAQITATRTAQLLLEDWMSTGGSEDYSPADLGLGFVPIQVQPLDKYNELGARLRDTMFSVTVDGFQMLVMLVSKDVSYDEAAEVTLRQLCVYVSLGSIFVKREEEAVENETIKPVILTTYVRVDAGGG